MCNHLGTRYLISRWKEKGGKLMLGWALTGYLTPMLCFSLAAGLSYKAEQENRTLLISSMDERILKKTNKGQNPVITSCRVYHPSQDFSPRQYFQAQLIALPLAGSLNGLWIPLSKAACLNFCPPISLQIHLLPSTERGQGTDPTS